MAGALTAEHARRLEACLAGDGVAVIPTDTVYGLACNPDSQRALRRVYELKRRPPAKPTAVMFFALEPALETLTELGPRTRAALAALLPGPVTLLLANPRGRYPGACSPAGGGTGPLDPCAPAGEGTGPLGRRAPAGAGAGLLGLRVPAFGGSLAALAGVCLPAAQSSANLSGSSDPRRLVDVPRSLREGADVALDGGELAGTASTVVDLSEYEDSRAWRIVREGPLDAQAVGQRLLLAS